MEPIKFEGEAGQMRERDSISDSASDTSNPITALNSRELRDTPEAPGEGGPLPQQVKEQRKTESVKQKQGANVFPQEGHVSAVQLAAILEQLSRANAPPLPLPGQEGMPWFQGSNATEWCEGMEQLRRNYRMGEEDFRLRIPLQVERTLREDVKAMKEWQQEGWDWERKFKPAFLKEHLADDIHQKMYSRDYIRRLAKKYKQEGEDNADALARFTRQYNQVAQRLIRDKASTKSEVTETFLKNIPKRAARKCIAGLKIDLKKPGTVEWDKVFQWVMQYTDNESQFRILEVSDSEEDSGLEELIDTVTSFKKTKVQAKSPVIPKADGIEQITKMLESFSAITQQEKAPKRTGGKVQILDPHSNYRIPLATRPQMSTYYPSLGSNNVQDGMDDSVEYVNVAQRRYCYFCQNQYPGKEDHSFKKDCPVFKEYIDYGYIHHNQYGELFWGPKDTKENPSPIIHDHKTQGSLAKAVSLRAKSNGWDQPQREVEQVQLIEDIYTAEVLNVDSPENFTIGEYVNAVSSEPRKRGRPPHGPNKVHKTPVKSAKNQNSTLASKVLKYAHLMSPEEDTLSHNGAEPDTEPMDIQDPNEPEIIYERVVDKTKKPRKRMMPRLMTNTFGSIEELDRDILSSTVNVSLGLILRECPAIWKRWTTRVGDPTMPPELNSHLINAINRLPTNLRPEAPEQVNHTDLVYTTNEDRESLPKVKVSVNGLGPVNAIPDSGSTINLIDSVLARKLNLPISPVQTTIVGISADSLNLRGICRDVRVALGGVSNVINIYVMENARNELLLGMPWFIAGEVSFTYRDGAQYLTVVDDDRETQASVWSAGQKFQTVMQSEN